MSTNPTVNFFSAGDGARPLLVGNPNPPSGQRSVNQWFNTAAFTEPIPITAAQCASGTCPAISWVNIGNTPSGVVRGPGRNNFNTAIFKYFRIRERFTAQFRAEAYNAFNHTQLTRWIRR